MYPMQRGSKSWDVSVKHTVQLLTNSLQVLNNLEPGLNLPGTLPSSLAFSLNNTYLALT